MLIWEEPNLIGKWLAEQGAGNLAPGTFTAIAYLQGGEIVGAVAFYNSNGSHCLVNLAMKYGRFPRALLHASLFYAFKQLGLKRVTFLIEADNIRSQKLLVHLGGKREATLREAGINGDLFIYALFPKDCYIWSRINGQKLRTAAES